MTTKLKLETLFFRNKMSTKPEYCYLSAVITYNKITPKSVGAPPTACVELFGSVKDGKIVFRGECDPSTKLVPILFSTYFDMGIDFCYFSSTVKGDRNKSSINSVLQTALRASMIELILYDSDFRKDETEIQSMGTLVYTKTRIPIIYSVLNTDGLSYMSAISLTLTSEQWNTRVRHWKFITSDSHPYVGPPPSNVVAPVETCARPMCHKQPFPGRAYCHECIGSPSKATKATEF